MTKQDRLWHERRAKEKLIDSETALAMGKPSVATALAAQAKAQLLLAHS